MQSYPITKMEKKKQEIPKTSAATMVPLGMQIPVQHQQLWHHPPWPQHNSSATLHQPQQTTQENNLFQQPQMGPIGSHMQLTFNTGLHHQT